MTLNQLGRTPGFLDPRALAKLGGLKLRARRVVEGFVAGLHRSPKHGFSIEFAQHRDYTPGDDLRYVDWKAYGRTDKLYVKQFEDETNLVCYIVLDISESMTYGSDSESLTKLAYAQTAAASLAWLVLHQRDAVGLITCDTQVRANVRPSTTPAHLKQMIAAMEGSDSHEQTAIEQVLHDVAERLHRRTLVIVISDFLDDVDSIIAGLRHLRHKQHEVRLLQVLDPAEVDFPFDQPMLFKGLEQLSDIVADGHAFRAAYLEEFSRYQRQLATQCRGLQVDYLLVRTDQPVERALSQLCAVRG